MNAQIRRDWDAAASAYRRASAAEPYNGALLYRFGRALRMTTDTAERDAIAARLKAFRDASEKLRGVVDEAQAVKPSRRKVLPDVYARLAEVRETMGRADEARAWHRLILQADPDDPTGLAALKRLESMTPAPRRQGTTDSP